MPDLDLEEADPPVRVVPDAHLVTDTAPAAMGVEEIEVDGVEVQRPVRRDQRLARRQHGVVTLQSGQQGFGVRRGHREF